MNHFNQTASPNAFEWKGHKAVTIDGIIRVIDLDPAITYLEGVTNDGPLAMQLSFDPSAYASNELESLLYGSKDLMNAFIKGGHGYQAFLNYGYPIDIAKEIDRTVESIIGEQLVRSIGYSRDSRYILRWIDQKMAVVYLPLE